MEIIKKHIEQYGYAVDLIPSDELDGYYCLNETTMIEFILDFSDDNYKRADAIQEKYESMVGREVKVVHLIHVKDNANEIMAFIEDEAHQNLRLLIYDEEDEEEFFLKDLWDVLFSLGTRV